MARRITQGAIVNRHPVALELHQVAGPAGDLLELPYDVLADVS
jgi:hypothetical protein